jgi:iron complex transport system substrate-binding protein
VSREQLIDLQPDLVLIKPCGFSLERTRSELCAAGGLSRWLPLEAWAKRPRVVAADGSAFFNRPGPRLADSAELAAAAIRGGPTCDTEHMCGIEIE